MEKFPAKKDKKEERLDFAKTLDEITKLAEEKLGNKGRKHFGAGQKVLSPEEARPFFIEQESAAAKTAKKEESATERRFRAKRNGPEEHEVDPYNGDYLI